MPYSGDSRNASANEDANTGRVRPLGLSAKLLLLTVGFVMLAEVLVFVPSVSNFRKNWLTERLAAAQVAALAAEAVPNHELPKLLREELLRTAKVHAVALKRGDARELILRSEMPLDVNGHYDLREARWIDLVADALQVYTNPAGRYIRVVGQPGFGAGEFIEIVIAEAPLKQAMIRFGLNILGLSILISMITAALVYFAINALFIRPISRLTRSIMRFGEAPEDPARVIVPSGRGDEIGNAERRLARMQGELATMLQQKSRLAALGLAVSKVNHDLRNMLASAQLISDRLGSVKDPTVQRFAPKLIASLDRAIRFCTETLKFGRAKEPAPERTMFALLPLVSEVGQSLGLGERPGPALRVEVDRALTMDADRDQIYRLLGNLMRNALQALETDEADKGEITVSARREGAVVSVTVSDDGPGVPAR
ncbi:MAG: HAMP domain-containing sensor histidine kinase, partial [Pseudomonadota bacterium]|nr:HAMP domain-containing sensor histidine kinase [Pseudomonadota bacterium]